MFLWILPALDLMATTSMLLLHHGVPVHKIAFPFSMYLMIKGIAFRDVASIIDLVIGVYLIGIIVFGFHTFLVYVFAAYLIQKAVFSFL